ncbi:MAG: universal stress protein [Proteobacteria bacterium]|nr:universal stress protein [Pseudomonadota bacterium]
MTVQHIMVAFDFSEPSRQALSVARRLQEALGAKVDVVHVHYDPFEGYKHMPQGSLWGTPTQFEAYMTGLRSLLDKAVDDAFGDEAPNVTRTILSGQPPDEILKASKAQGTDLICVGTTGKRAMERALLGSVAEKLVRASHVPVLTVRSG